MAKAPMMPLWTDALIGDTTHLSAEQFGCYVLILIATWRNNGKALPDDDARMSKICKITVTKWRRKVRPIVCEFFDISETGWHQHRLEKEWNRVKRLIDLRSAIGRVGGAASAAKRRGNHREAIQSPEKKKPSSSLPSSARAFALSPSYRTRDDNTWTAIGNVVAKAIGNELPEPPIEPAAEVDAMQRHMEWLRARGDRDTLDLYVQAALSDDPEDGQRMFDLVEKQIGEAI